MSHPPHADAPLSDDDFLALVDEEDTTATDAGTSTADPASPAPDPADDESSGTSTELTDDGNSDEGSEERPEVEGEQPAPVAESVPAAAVAAAPPATPPVAAAPTTPAPGVPFQYKAAGGTHVLPGALELADGSVLIPKEARAEHLRRLASERELSANFRKTQGQFQRELTAAKAARSARDVEAEAVYKLFGDIKAMTPDERWDYFQKFDEEAPKLELQIARRQIEEERAALAAAKAPPEPTPEEKQEARAAVLTTELSKSYYAFAERLKEVPGGDLITPEEFNRVFQRWAKHPDRLVSIENGQEIFNDADIGEDLALLIQAKQQMRTAGYSAGPALAGALVPAPATGTAALPAAAARNAALNADRNVIPPVVAPGRVPKAAAAKGAASYKGKHADWKRDFALGKLDAED